MRAELPLAGTRAVLAAARAYQYGMKRGASGMSFDRFGRGAGLRLLGRGHLGGLKWLLRPMVLERYFEFPYVLERISERAACLDVSSPRLFSMYVALERKPDSILMINPDPRDISQSAAAARWLGLRNVACECRGIASLEEPAAQYDCIWSISAIEHIRDGPIDDSYAAKVMYRALRPGGRLIMTTVVDRRYWEEYRSSDSYGTQKPAQDGSFFFQRWYDEDAIQKRLCAALGEPPREMKWFGETRSGVYDAVITRWLSGDWTAPIESPRIVADCYREYASFREMPGKGVACFFFTKAGTGHG
jgi:SAM-dependent methyltransferase